MLGKLCATVLGAAMTVGVAAAPAEAESGETVTLSGVAWQFETGVPIPDARVTVDETGESTKTDVRGKWSIEVPKGSDATPYVAKTGFHTTYAQTYTNVQKDIGDINHQTPDVPIAELLRTTVSGYQNGRDPLDGCVIVSTVSQPWVVGMTQAEIAAHPRHGVAGATVSSSPKMSESSSLYYFNDLVTPVPHRDETSGDGGVMFTNVEPGQYEIAASHPDEKFAKMTATCEGNRLINAGPPQGLHGIPPQ